MPAPLRLIDNRAIVLIVISDDLGATIAQIAERAGVTERTARRCLEDLQAAGVISRTSEGRGRRTGFLVDWDAPLQFPNVVSHRTVRHLVAALCDYPRTIP